MSQYENDPEDGLPREIVGRWAVDKHWLLGAFVEASSPARASLEGQPSFVDLYCGPGRICTTCGGPSQDGGAVVAIKRSVSPSRVPASPFKHAFIADADERNVEACKQRTATLGVPVHPFVGEAAETVNKIVSLLPKRGLHLAFLDPYALNPMPFSVIQTLSQVPRVDLLIHYSTFDLRRNLEHPQQSADHFEAVAPGWNRQSTRFSKSELRHKFFQHWSGLVQGCGYHFAGHPYHVRNSRNSEIYMLTLASKHPLGTKIWDSLRPHPQRDLL